MTTIITTRPGRYVRRCSQASIRRRKKTPCRLNRDAASDHVSKYLCRYNPFPPTTAYTPSANDGEVIEDGTTFGCVSRPSKQGQQRHDHSRKPSENNQITATEGEDLQIETATKTAVKNKKKARSKSENWRDGIAATYVRGGAGKLPAQGPPARMPLHSDHPATETSLLCFPPIHDTKLRWKCVALEARLLLCSSLRCDSCLIRVFFFLTGTRRRKPAARMCACVLFRLPTAIAVRLFQFRP